MLRSRVLLSLVMAGACAVRHAPVVVAPTGALLERAIEREYAAAAAAHDRENHRDALSRLRIDMAALATLLIEVDKRPYDRALVARAEHLTSVVAAAVAALPDDASLDRQALAAHLYALGRDLGRLDARSERRLRLPWS